jgi:DNA-binding MarR family transcriptional regulator
VTTRFAWQRAIVESGLSPTQRHVALTLALHMDADGGSAFPSLETQAEETGLDRSTVRRALQILDRLGWLERSPGGGRGRRTNYQARLPQTGAERPRSRRETGAQDLENRGTRSRKQGHSAPRGVHEVNREVARARERATTWLERDGWRFADDDALEVLSEIGLAGDELDAAMERRREITATRSNGDRRPFDRAETPA